MRITMNQVFEAAKASGGAHSAMLGLLKSGRLDWKNTEQVEKVSTEFRLGRIVGYLGLETREDGQAVMDKSKKERSEKEQLSFRAAVSAWSSLLRDAGAPNQRSGTTRAPRKPAEAEKTQTPLDLAAEMLRAPKRQVSATILHVVPKAKTIADVDAFATRMGDLLSAFMKQNPRFKTNGYQAVFQAYIQGVKSLHEGQEDRKAA